MWVDYYKVLGLTYGTQRKVIRKKYLELSRRYHPDKNPGKDTKTIFESIKTAYDILSDNKAREIYNLSYREMYPIAHDEDSDGEPEIVEDVDEDRNADSQMGQGRECPSATKIVIKGKGLDKLVRIMDQNHIVIKSLKVRRQRVWVLELATADKAQEAIRLLGGLSQVTVEPYKRTGKRNKNQGRRRRKR